MRSELCSCRYVSRHFYVNTDSYVSYQGKIFPLLLLLSLRSIIVTNIIIIDAIALALAGGEVARRILLFINFFTVPRGHR